MQCLLFFVFLQSITIVRMKRVLKWLAVVLLTPILLFIILTALLYFPPVQNWAVRQVAAYASRETGMDISIDRVCLAFPLDLEVDGFKMIKPVDMTQRTVGSTPDTIADVKRLIADVRLLPLFHGEVEIDALELNDAKVNTLDFIPSVRLKGDLGRLYLQSHGINLTAETVKVDDVSIENSRLDIALNDSVPEDTTESSANWKIDIEKLNLAKTKLTLHLAGDTIGVHADMERAVARNAFLGLKDGVYKVGQLDWDGGSFDYGRGIMAFGRRDDSKRQRGFDADYLSMSEVHLGVDSLIIATPQISANIRAGSFKEKSGLQVDSFHGNFFMDDNKLSLKNAEVVTPYSTLAADYQMDLNTFDSENPGKLYADIDGNIGKHDIQVFAPSLPQAMMSRWPNQPLTLKGHAEGNLQYITFKDLRVSLPTAFNIKGTGWIANPTDSDRMRANVNLKGRTDDLSFVTAILPRDVQQQVHIPRGIGIDGNFQINGPQYAADFTATEGGGSLRAKGTFDSRTLAYNVKATANRLQLQHFVPNMGLGPFTGDVTMQGHGTDFLDPNSGAKISANIRSFRYGNYDLSGIGGDIRLSNGMLHADVNSTGSMVGGRFRVDGKLTANDVDLWIKGHVSRADLRQLGVIDQRYIVSTDADLHVKSDMKSKHSVVGHCGNFLLSENRSTQGLVPLVSGDFDIDGSMRGNQVAGNFDGRLGSVDLYQMGVVDKPFTTSFGANIDFRSDLDESYDVRGMVCDLHVSDRLNSYDAGDLSVDIHTDKTATHALLSSSDFYLNADAVGGIKTLSDKCNNLIGSLQKQIEDKNIDQMALRKYLPDASLTLRSGSDNILSKLIEQQGIAFRTADIQLQTSPSQGINGDVSMGALFVASDSITIDSLSLALRSDSENLNYNLALLNDAKNDYPFKGMIQGSLLERGLTTRAIILDENDKTGIDVALLAQMEDEGIRMKITSDDAVLGYKRFAVNDANYIFIGTDQRVSANMKLLADDGAGAYIYTDDDDDTALQNITLSMRRFDLEKMFQVLPFTPSVSGILDGDYHVVQTANDLTVSSDMTIKNLFYEHSPMGDLGLQFVYMPQDDGSHYVDAIISRNEREIGTLVGTYNSEGDGRLDADCHLDRFPLDYINGFVPDKIVGLRGTGEGELTVRGPLNALDINGELYLDSSYVFSEPYGVEMRFANDPVRIQNSKLLFENFEMFANNDSPLNIQGYLDFSNMDRMMLDVRMRAQNFLLIDAKENPRSEAYGKAYVNFFGSMRGPLDGLTMRGRLDVLGNTDMTYVLRESVLTSDSELDDLVRFVDFNDSTAQTVVVRPDIAGFTMDMSIAIDEQAHIVCALNADHSNYIDLIGGGDLTMHYDPANDLRLDGRYTLSSGELKYALPIIPLRTFNIQNGSYLEFQGDAANPRLNITATENLKSTVSDGSSHGKIVDFVCGVKLTETLSKPTIEFIIDAPEDMQIQNELNTKSTEERGKLAVSMLASGMYLGESGSTANSAMSGALASFMQSEINHISGNALRSMGLDLSANMETSTDASGALHTDYTFKFSKRLLNNRLRIIMGGRVSTGSSAAGDNGAFFDSFSLEYRLNEGETQYLKLFYERDAYDWLEGSLSEFGAGFMWRRKLDHLKDIVKFKTQKPVMMPPVGQRRDSLVNFTNEKK